MSLHAWHSEVNIDLRSVSLHAWHSSVNIDVRSVSLHAWHSEVNIDLRSVSLHAWHRSVRNHRICTDHLMLLENLSSLDNLVLNVFPMINTNIGTWTCSLAAPIPWNLRTLSVILVEDITQYRRYLKTYLYNLVYLS